MISNNPHSICTWSDGKSCDHCNIRGKLICKQDTSFRKKFLLTHFTFRGLTFFGLIFIGIFSNQWWLAYLYTTGFLLNFAILEPRLLCSHCPFYAEQGRFLHCNTLYGLPKLWKYRPGPITKPEMALQLLSGGFVDLFPFLSFSYGIYLFHSQAASLLELLAMIGFSILMLLQMVQMNASIQSEVCPRCPNFSCLMNKVPHTLRDAFIKQNPVMREAWEKAGHTFD